ncbi:hypothetical protein [Streptomyces sp. NPDC046685]|uniref:DUF7848 domain-containing protein n=1 Tax=Streptomyces sp. NPDC046685 TaxID=3157202 RepID=UPI0033D7C889
MSTREVHAYAEWTLSADNREGVPVAIFQMTCMTCHAMSEAADNDGTPQQTWALDHTGRNPHHRGFKLITETYWRVEPHRGNPYREVRP